VSQYLIPRAGVSDYSSELGSRAQFAAFFYTLLTDYSTEGLVSGLNAQPDEDVREFFVRVNREAAIKLDDEPEKFAFDETLKTSRAAGVESLSTASAQNRGLVSDYITVPLSIQRRDWRSAQPGTLVQPASLSNDLNELVKVPLGRGGVFSDADLRVIHAFGGDGTTRSTQYGAWAFMPDQPIRDTAAPAEDYFAYNIMPDPQVEKAYNTLGVFSSNADKPLANQNMITRVAHAARAGDPITRAVGLTHLGISLLTNAYVTSLLEANLPAPIQFKVVWPHVSFDTHGTLALCEQAGIMQHTEPMNFLDVDRSAKGTLTSRWTLGAVVNPTRVVYNPFGYITDYCGGKSTALVAAGNTTSFSSLAPLNSLSHNPFDLSGTYSDRSSAGDAIVFTHGFGGRDSEPLLALGGPLQAPPSANISHAFASSINAATPGLLYIDAVTGSLGLYGNTHTTGIYGSIFDDQTGQAHRASLFCDLAAHRRVGDTDASGRCSGFGFFANEKILYESLKAV
jgi:hypothetical protein